ncbi:MAG TPA: aspartyl/asparaginyl beta-hydroxylase domain-containing protein [Candidatus Angelobacter sp.]|jgi:hypothetical protein|nr:aspartyl/asparaginyl beta-hydroxylase domain-containing protein [Candidatus Angelobacter sp.]
MHVAATARDRSVGELQRYTQFFQEFDHEVTKYSIPAAYQAPIARWLEEDALNEISENGQTQCIIVGTLLQEDTPVADFTGVVKFVMHTGDMFVERIAFQDFDCARKEISRILDAHETVFFELWEEKPECRQIVDYFDLKWLCTRILQTDELVGVYASSSCAISVEYDECDLIAIAPVKIEKLDIADCAKSLERVPAYIDHYSMCSKDKTWSAVSIRGYGGLSEFISKPSEMSQAWRSSNPEKLDWVIADTPLRAQLPEFEPLINAIPGNKHRIRLMRLKPGGGEIYKHTDIQDKDAGTAEGKLMRIHIPIVTSKYVKFECWDLRGVSQINHMGIGEAWYMDVRKPHRVENYGKIDRIHLVIDVESNESLKRLLSGSEYRRVVSLDGVPESLPALFI